MIHTYWHSSFLYSNQIFLSHYSVSPAAFQTRLEFGKKHKNVEASRRAWCHWDEVVEGKAFDLKLTTMDDDILMEDGLAPCAP